MIQLMLVLTTAWLGPVATPNPAVLGGGGPDAYGYRWIDNDTTAPEAPRYVWNSIRAAGTPINGLADDNVIGPFPIGFDFPYYWYRVNSIYVGSNGYIAFGDNGLSASPFPNMPNSTRPNNVVAGLMSDLEFGGTGNPAKAFYWTNAALDTFIVQYDSVRFWSTGGLNTFQIILSRADSAITVMYQKQSGAPYQGWVPGNATVGIENITGQLGLSYLYGNIPSGNLIHDTLAIRYYPPATTSMQVHDLAAWQVMNEENGGIFLLRDQPAGLWAKIKNTGNQSEAAAPVYCIVRNASNTVVYADTMSTRALGPGELDSLVFDPPWTPTTNGMYTLRVITNLTGDMFRRNDTVKLETRVVTYPAELGYDNGIVSASMYWNGNSGGFGNEFVAPSYPIEVTGIKANLSSATTVGCTLWLLAGDGPGGSPGTMLERTTVSVNQTTPSWFQYNFPTPIVINSGKFFVCVNSGASQAPSYSMDTTSPRCMRGWEFTGSWAPGRDRPNQDVMMHALVRAPSGVYELPPSPNTPMLTARPNPFGNTTTIWFSRNLVTPARVEIYNAAGELVRDMMVAGASASWDGRGSSGRRLAGGIYFAKLLGNNVPLKVVLTR
jgi:hypothetical protein